jgi:DNA-binding NtrC family response regulator
MRGVNTSAGLEGWKGFGLDTVTGRGYDPRQFRFPAGGQPMVLVVDDDPKVVRTLERMLGADGHAVKTAANGAEAYGLVKSPDCECMVLDVKMPGINGVELLLLMQADDIHVPTIVMAGFEDFEEREMRQFANVVGFVRKPFDAETMRAAVEKHRRHRRPAGAKHT